MKRVIKFIQTVWPVWLHFSVAQNIYARQKKLTSGSWFCGIPNSDWLFTKAVKSIILFCYSIYCFPCGVPSETWQNSKELNQKKRVSNFIEELILLVRNTLDIPLIWNYFHTAQIPCECDFVFFLDFLNLPFGINRQNIHIKELLNIWAPVMEIER